MQAKTEQRKRRGAAGRKRRKLHDLTRAARELGVNHSHLWRVLYDGRESKRLTERYREWQARNPPNAKPTDKTPS